MQNQTNVLPGRVTFLDGRGGLPMVEVTTPWSNAEVYLHGAHVTHFKKKDEAPLLFVSQCSRFTDGQPIRGGVPVIFPWFGPREGEGLHGFVRIKTWKLEEHSVSSEGIVTLRFSFPDVPEAGSYPPFQLEYVVTVGETLTMELVTRNASENDILEFEECLHTYFSVDDIGAVSISGLKGASYLDKVDNFARKTQEQDPIRISSEVDRVYPGASGTVEIRDARLGRTIRVEKESSNSTVVWNPWIAKAQQMPDFGNEEYRNMVCVESGNVGCDKIALAPGETSRMKVILSSVRDE